MAASDAVHVMGAKPPGTPEVTFDVGAMAVDHFTIATNDHECQLQYISWLETRRFGVEDDEGEIFERGIGGDHAFTVR